MNLALALLAAGVAAATAAAQTAAGCSTDEDCSLLGVCGGKAAGVCLCDPGWQGPDCGQLKLAPVVPGSGYNLTAEVRPDSTLKLMNFMLKLMNFMLKLMDIANDGFIQTGCHLRESHRGAPTSSPPRQPVAPAVPALPPAALTAAAGTCTRPSSRTTAGSPTGPPTLL